MKVAFISGPYRSDTVYGIMENIREAERWAIKYWQQGYAVICPHKNSALFDGLCDDLVWLDGDIELLKRSDVIVMIPGWERSAGAMEERAFALANNMDIIYEEGKSWK